MIHVKYMHICKHYMYDNYMYIILMFKSYLFSIFQEVVEIIMVNKHICKHYNTTTTVKPVFRGNIWDTEKVAL